MVKQRFLGCQVIRSAKEQPAAALSPLYPEGAELLAPLADYTDAPYRRACRACGCRYAFTPLVDVGCLVYSSDRGGRSLHRGADEPWLGVQLVGSNPTFFEEAVRVVNDHQYDVLDLNMGCPMPKIVKRGAGAALCRHPDLALACLDVLLRRSRFPVTAKIRILDEIDPAPTVRLALALQGAGIRALTIHGRLEQKIYAGPVATSVIRAVAAALRIPVIANGGVFSAADAVTLRQETGCSRIMVARGSIGNPWIFRDFTAGRALPPPRQAEVCAVMRLHVDGMVELYGADLALRCARKIILAYMKGRGFSHLLKNRVCALRTQHEFHGFIQELSREEPRESASVGRCAPNPLSTE